MEIKNKMKEDLIKLLEEFKYAVDKENEKRPLFEDDVEYNLENFYKWLVFKPEE